MADRQKLTKTIEYVQPNPRAWEDKGFFVSANFDDDSEGSVFATKANLDQTVASLTALKNQPTEFELEEKNEFNGIPQWKIVSYPGKPAGGGGGARGGGGMSHSQAGMLAAASALGPVFAVRETNILDMPEQIIVLSEALTEHLFSRRKSDTETKANETQPAQQATPVAPSSSLSLAQLKHLKGIVSEKGWDEATVKEQTDGKGLSGLDAEEANALIEAWS